MVRLNRISIQPMLGTVALFSLERAGIAASERFPAQERLEDRSLERYRRTPELGTRSLILAGDGSFFLTTFRAARTGRVLAFVSALLGLGIVSLSQAAYVVVDTGHTPEHPGATGASGRVEHLYNLDLNAAVAHTSLLMTTACCARRRTAEKSRCRTAQLQLRMRTFSFRFITIRSSNNGSMQAASASSMVSRSSCPGAALIMSKAGAARAIGKHMIVAGETPSFYHATPIRGENRPLIDALLGIDRYDDLVVLKTAPMPAVLIEAGVIANPDKENRLRKSDTITHLAGAIAEGVETCQ